MSRQSTQFEAVKNIEIGEYCKSNPSLVNEQDKPVIHPLPL